MHIITYIIFGILAGLVGGFFGLGGGIVLVPLFVFALGFTQHQAQGTALAAMVPPITLLAAIRYYYAGNVKVAVALFAGLGFIVGGFLTAHIVQTVPSPILKKFFGLFLFFVSIKMIFER